MNTRLAAFLRSVVFLSTRSLAHSLIAVMLLSAAGARSAVAQSAGAGETDGDKTGERQVVELDTERGDAMIGRYFREQTSLLSEACLSDVNSLDDWRAKRDELRRQLFEMMGLDPLPPRTDLAAKVTGTRRHEDVVVENLHFQSRPGLYVTGNVYRPADLEARAPAILYVCGHGAVKRDGVSYGNKVHYHHHGLWFARHGYVCLTIDSLQLGEIEGIHHGTYRHGMWWWNGRGYTPAGVEAWNCIRALDYLQSRDDVDGERLGVTGRSGGGAYSWWVAALDDRIKAAVPVAGITDLRNHVVDGCVEGHCDCMYFVNTYRWDYPLVAALVAPRPLLISNTDRDGIFPLDGVVRTYEAARRIYQLHGEGDKIGLHVTSGPHKDTQELRIHAFRWFNRFLKDDESLISRPAAPAFEPTDLKVFEHLPDDQLNTKIHDSFVPAAPSPAPPEDVEQWTEMRDRWRASLRDKTFRAWPASPVDLGATSVFDEVADGIRFRAIDFRSQSAVDLRLYVVSRDGLEKPELIVLNVVDDSSWLEFLAMMRVRFQEQLAGESLPPADPDEYGRQRDMLESFDWAMAYVAPRGIGPTAWDQSERKQIQVRRRFLLLGQSLDGMRVWDARRAIQALRTDERYRDTPLWLQARGRMAGVALVAALHEPRITRLDLHDLPPSLRSGPYLLNARRFLDTPQLVALAAEESRVVLYEDDDQPWGFPRAVAARLDWDAKRLQFRPPIGRSEGPAQP